MSTVSGNSGIAGDWKSWLPDRHTVKRQTTRFLGLGALFAVGLAYFRNVPSLGQTHVVTQQLQSELQFNTPDWLERIERVAQERHLIDLPEGLDSLPEEERLQKTLSVLEEGCLSPSALQKMRSNFSEFSNPSQFSILENVLAYQEVDSEIDRWINGSFPSLLPEQQFQLARMSLLKESPLYPSLREFLPAKERDSLIPVESRVGESARKKEEIKQELLFAEQYSEMRPSLEEWERETQSKVAQVSWKIVELLESQGRENSGITFLKGEHEFFNKGNAHDGMAPILVLEVEELPGLILKIFEPYMESEVQYRYEIAVGMQEAQGRWDRLQAPFATMIDPTLFDNRAQVLVVEKKEVLDDRIAYQERVRLMSRDPELRPILREMFEQLADFVAYTGYREPRWNNIPLLKYQGGFALVDVDYRGRSRVGGLYEEGTDALVSSFNEENFPILRKALLRHDPSFVNYDFEKAESFRKRELRLEKKQEASLLKRGLLDNDPISIKRGVLLGLNPADQEIALALVANLNQKLEEKAYYSGNRKVYLSSSELQSSVKDLKRVMDHLVRKEVLIDVKEDYYGHYIITL